MHFTHRSKKCLLGHCDDGLVVKRLRDKLTLMPSSIQKEKAGRVLSGNWNRQGSMGNAIYMLYTHCWFGQLSQAGNIMNESVSKRFQIDAGRVKIDRQNDGSG